MGNMFESTAKLPTVYLPRIIWNIIMKVSYDRHDLAKMQDPPIPDPPIPDPPMLSIHSGESETFIFTLPQSL